MLSVVGFAALAATGGLPLSLALKGALALVVGATTVHAVLHHALLKGPAAVVHLEVNARGEVSCVTRSGLRHEVQVLGTSCVTPWLVVLNLRQQRRWLLRHVLLLPGMAEPDALRRLRVGLRWSHPRAGT